MLTHLSIQGLAIIDSLALDLAPGFNVITGETGAGKSILIKALGLLLGAKGHPEVVRKGAPQASVSGIFQVPLEHSVVEILGDLGIPHETSKAGVELILRRQITPAGRSHAWINDMPVTIAALRTIGYYLIDIFGQNDNQKLFDPSQHLSFIDKGLATPELRLRYGAAYTACHERVRRLEGLAAILRKKLENEDYLAFRHEKLAEFAPDLSEYQSIAELCKRAETLVSSRDSLLKAQECLDLGADGEALSRRVWQAARYLQEIKEENEDAGTLIEQIELIAGQLEEVSYQIGSRVSEVDVDEGELEQAQTRLAGYEALFRKYGANSIADLLAEEETLRKELDSLAHAELDLKSELKGLKTALEELVDLAKGLSDEREKAFRHVKRKVESELKELKMPHARLEVLFEPIHKSVGDIDLSMFDPALGQSCREVLEGWGRLGESGRERGEFLLAANKGEPLLPLRKFASGGEISRIMLALKHALTAGAETCVLVFDEIDSGISGQAADVVGAKMRTLARGFQVICISHLAQVAAYADRHFVVEKSTRKNRTESRIVALDLKESSIEIARLLSGTEITESSIANARQLIERARGVQFQSAQL